MTRKRFFSLLCTGAIVLAGCSKAPAEETPESPEPAETQETEPVQEQVFSIGNIDGTVYTNDTLHIRIELPQGWVYASEEDLVKLNQTVIDSFENEELKAAMEDGAAVMGVYATSPDGTQQINIMFQEMPMSVYTPEMIINASIPEVRSQLESQGMTVVSITKEPIVFLGEDSHCMRIEGSLNNISLYETQVYAKEGNYLAVITCSSVVNDTTMDLVGMITSTK